MDFPSLALGLVTRITCGGLPLRDMKRTDRKERIASLKTAFGSSLTTMPVELLVEAN